ncbi:MAG: aldehyde dehydrogenase family protein [Candidatus Baltobacteraceae bacterium]
MYKLFINGAFVRSESARSDPMWDGQDFGANIARGSRKDVRDAVAAARAAHAKWRAVAPSTRGLVLYRLAEMIEARRAEFEELTGDAREVDGAIDRCVWYAGWCDKFGALLSTRNPVAGPHFNFSTAEPTGVVALLAPDEPPLLGLISTVLPAIVPGNAVVVVASQKDPRTAMVFAEAIAVSDLPPGVVNIITGHRSELAPVLAKHMDVNALGFPQEELAAELQALGSENVKRVRVIDPSVQSLDEIAAYCEIKTIWHPAGM